MIHFILNLLKALRTKHIQLRVFAAFVVSIKTMQQDTDSHSQMITTGTAPAALPQEAVVFTKKSYLISLNECFVSFDL